MNLVLVLAPLALLIAISFAAAFVWAASSGQYDDLDTPPQRLFLEENSHDDRS